MLHMIAKDNSNEIPHGTTEWITPSKSKHQSLFVPLPFCPAEGLVEEQPCLELRDKGEPRQHDNGQEDEEPHGVLVHPRHLLDGVPWSHLPKRSTGPLPELGTARTSA